MHLLNLTKSSDLEHLLFSAHRATPNMYKNYLLLAAEGGYNLEGKHNNNNNIRHFLRLMFQFRELHKCFYNPWQQVTIPSHNKIKPMTPKRRTSILLASPTVINKF